jgi:glycosyltransferase involved in cell wall biosynthesis
MRLLHVVPTYFPAIRYGGPIHSVHGLCAAMAARGHDVHVFTTSVDGPGDSAVPLGRPVDMDGVKVWYFPSPWLRRLYWSPAMARTLKREVGGFDLVHLHSVFLWPTWAAARAARRFGVPYVLSPRGMLVRDLVRKKSKWLKRAWIRLFERENIAAAAAIHVTSATEAAELSRFAFTMRRVINIPNGISPPGVTTPGTISDDVQALLGHRALILFLGRINWKKGLDRLIPALTAIPEAHLAIVGNDEDGLLPELEALVERHGLHGRVSFLARAVDRADRDRLMTVAKVFALPSYSENFGNTVLEAMALGCPVLVTPEVGAAEIVRESGGGRVVPGDPTVFGRALRELIDDPDRAEIGARGRRFVTEHLGWANVAQRMEKAYLDLCNARVSERAVDR